MRGPGNSDTLGLVSDVWPTTWEVPTRPPVLGGSSGPSPDDRSRSNGNDRGRRPLAAAIPMVMMVGVAATVLLTAAIVSHAVDPRSEDLSQQERVDLLARAQISTVRVAARACPGVTHGSGFVVDGLLFTSGHIAANDQRLKVDRPGLPVESPVVATSVSLDLAIADGSELVAVEMSLAQTPPPEGETVFFAGFPGGGELESAQARIVRYGPALEWGLQGRRVMLLDPGIRAGFSGGPVLNRDGKLVGMLAGVDLVTGLAVAIPGDELGAVIDLAVQTWAPVGGLDPVGSVTHAARPCGG